MQRQRKKRLERSLKRESFNEYDEPSTRNPQAFNQLQQLMQSGQNPQVLLSNMMGQLTPQQKQQFDSVANQYGLKR